MNTRDHLQVAIGIVGSSSRLAKLCGVTRTAIWKALRTGRVSASTAVAIEVATGGRVRREHLLPEIFSQTLADVA